MHCPPEIAAIIAEILSAGLLRIRSLGWAGNAERCAVEADHVHNLPALLVDYKPDLLAFYWRVERIDFIGRTSDGVAAFEPLWSALAEHISTREPEEIPTP
jgi:hypothetical protein